MITVTIFINGNPILTRSATRDIKIDKESYSYHLDDGRKIVHKLKDGAVVLAKGMLDCIDEEFVKRRER